MKQVNRIIKKSDKYNIKPGRMEQLFVKALKTSAEKNLGYNHK